MLRNLKKRYISWAGIPENNTQSREMGFSGFHFGQKQKKAYYFEADQSDK